MRQVSPWLQAALDRIEARMRDAEREAAVTRRLRRHHAEMLLEIETADVHGDYESGDHLGGQP